MFSLTESDYSLLETVAKNEMYIKSSLSVVLMIDSLPAFLGRICFVVHSPEGGRGAKRGSLRTTGSGNVLRKEHTCKRVLQRLPFVFAAIF